MVQLSTKLKSPEMSNVFKHEIKTNLARKHSGVTNINLKHSELMEIANEKIDMFVW